MAPFIHLCSVCQSGTRKRVSDPITRKLIYLCPTCCEKENVDVEKMTGPNETKALKDNEGPEENKVEGVKVPVRPKITPPLMQVVVINNRKFIAVSETADWDSP